MSDKTIMGKMYVVRNSKPKPNASSEYAALWIEDESGAEESERCLFFRIHDALEMPVMIFPESLEIEKRMKLGRIYEMHSGENVFYVAKVIDLNDRECIIRMTGRKLRAAEKLASSNEEDIPKRSWISDLID